MPYDVAYYELIGRYSRESAAEVVPIVVKMTGCKSVVDVGCGDGTWLHAFEEQGVSDVEGYDGDYVDRSTLKVAPDRFHAFDLKQPLRVDRKFDLAVSLEVGEHLPDSCADTLVASLTGLAPIVLFSAAIPGQGGETHINEQWQDYWAERFVKRGYIAADCIRPRVWTNPQVQYWYAQNMLLYIQADHFAANPNLSCESLTDLKRARLVHPGCYNQKMLEYAYAADHDKVSLGKVLKLLPSAFRNTVTRRFGSR